MRCHMRVWDVCIEIWYDMSEMKGNEKCDCVMTIWYVICDYEMYALRYDMINKCESNMWNDNGYVLHEICMILTTKMKWNGDMWNVDVKWKEKVIFEMLMWYVICDI